MQVLLFAPARQAPVAFAGTGGTPREAAAGMTAGPDIETLIQQDDEQDIDFGPGIDPERLALCLDVLAELDGLHVDHPDAITVRRAVGGIFRTLKQRRR